MTEPKTVMVHLEDRGPLSLFVQDNGEVGLLCSVCKREWAFPFEPKEPAKPKYNWGMPSSGGYQSGDAKLFLHAKRLYPGLFEDDSWPGSTVV